MRARLQLCVDGEVIECTVIRSAARKRTMQLTVDAGRNVVVRVPVRTGLPEIRAFVERRRAWITGRLEKAIAVPAERQFTEGAALPYMGRTLALEIVPAPGNRASVAMRGEALRAAVPFDSAGAAPHESVRRAVLAWYRTRAAAAVDEFIRSWTPFAGKNPTRVWIRDQKTRWGSCAADGSLRLNWRLAMADPQLIEYVVVHELAHLTHRNHGPGFWAEVERALPDWKARRLALRQAAPGLTL
jgi:predicted metal-dependent hydrolase